MHNDGCRTHYYEQTFWAIVYYVAGNSKGFELVDSQSAHDLAALLSERTDVDRVTVNNDVYRNGKKWKARPVTLSYGEEEYLRMLMRDYPDNNHSIAIARKFDNK